MPRTKRNYLNIPIDPVLRHDLKVMAAIRGVTLADLVTSLVRTQVGPILTKAPAPVPQSAVFPVVPSPDVARRPPKPVPFKPRPNDAPEAKEAQEVKESPRKPKPVPPEDVADPDIWTGLFDFKDPANPTEEERLANYRRVVKAVEARADATPDLPED